MSLWSEFKGRRRRYERVDYCLNRGGLWGAYELHQATGLGYSTIYLRLAQLEGDGSGRYCGTSVDGRRMFTTWPLSEPVKVVLSGSENPAPQR